MTHEQVVELLVGMHAQLRTVSRRLDGTEFETEAALLIGLRAQTQALIEHFATTAEPIEDEPARPKRRAVFGQPSEAPPRPPDGGATPIS